MIAWGDGEEQPMPTWQWRLLVAVLGVALTLLGVRAWDLEALSHPVHAGQHAGARR